MSVRVGRVGGMCPVFPPIHPCTMNIENNSWCLWIRRIMQCWHCKHSQPTIYHIRTTTTSEWMHFLLIAHTLASFWRTLNEAGYTKKKNWMQMDENVIAITICWGFDSYIWHNGTGQRGLTETALTTHWVVGQTGWSCKHSALGCAATCQPKHYKSSHRHKWFGHRVHSPPQLAVNSVYELTSQKIPL